MCFHTRLKCILIVYVDDFKLSGPAENLAEAWSLIRKDISMGDPTPQGRYLGCNHIPADSGNVRSITYDVRLSCSMH
jgi:hypothetical protein